jgi:hypothetical protein
MTNLPNKLIMHAFNGRAAPQRITVGKTKDGQTHIWFPGCTETVIVRQGSPVNIDISGYGNSPGDLAILIEAFLE